MLNWEEDRNYFMGLEDLSEEKEQQEQEETDQDSMICMTEERQRNSF